MPQSEATMKSDSSSQPSQPKTGTQQTRLEKQKFDFASVRIQMILGNVFVLAICILAYQPILHSGFLLDDFLHVDYVARAFAGSPQDFLANFTGNWAGSDLMKSYRPFASVSFFIDYFLWHANAYGFHLTNVLLTAACCLTVSLIALQMTGRNGNQLLAAPAVWAGLLFAVYPLHPEATAWIVGRVDLLCTLFYLISVFCFLRYQEICERRYLVASLVSFALAFTSKEMAVTLPVVITAAALLLRREDPPRSTGKSTDLLKAIAESKYFWILFAVLTAVRTFFLGSLVGGYGGSDLHSLFISLFNFLDRPTIYKLMVPISEEMHPLPQLQMLCATMFVSILAIGFIKWLSYKTDWKPICFLFVWCAVALLPTFQIWHIYPNLVGSRLFFVSSAPLCIMLALLAAPATEALSRRSAAMFAAVGTTALSLIFVSWSYALSLNLFPWEEAGKRMTLLQKQLQEISVQANGKEVALLSLPTDYKGAGMVTRPIYLTIALRPPFHSPNISTRFAASDVASATKDLHAEMRKLAEHKWRYVWNEPSGRFVPWTPSSGKSHLRQKFDLQGRSALEITPPNVMTINPNDWQVVSSDSPYVEQHADFLRVFAGASGRGSTPITVGFRDKLLINPLEVHDVIVRAKIHDNDSPLLTDEPFRPEYLGLSWRASDESASESQEFSVPFKYVTDGLYVATVGDSADWCRAKNISHLQIQCSPGRYVADIYELEIGMASANKTK
jgi:hypothetical protein